MERDFFDNEQENIDQRNCALWVGIVIGFLLGLGVACVIMSLPKSVFNF